LAVDMIACLVDPALRPIFRILEFAKNYRNCKKSSQRTKKG
jgi:hypothetical protein